MAAATLALFIPACFALNLTPGPNNILVFSNASRMGLTRAILGGLGRLPAFAALIGLVAAGLGSLLAVSETAFVAVKLAGALYLAYVGWKLWTAPAPSLSTQSAPNSLGQMVRRDFLIAIGNPKAIAIFTAFLPQFIDFTETVWSQFLTLGGIFLGFEALVIVIYAGLGQVMGQLLTPARLHLLNRGVGGFLIVSGLSLALEGRAK